MSDDLLLDIIARSIGRTITQENYRQRAADVLRSVKENDLTLPQPTNLIEHEITRLRADIAAVTDEREKFKQILISESKKVGELQLASIDNIAEITQLRAKNMELSDALSNEQATCIKVGNERAEALNQLDSLRAENKKMREALNDVISAVHSTRASIGVACIDIQVIDRARTILEGAIK